jgi:hypothetical protein
MNFKLYTGDWCIRRITDTSALTHLLEFTIEDGKTSYD